MATATTDTLPDVDLKTLTDNYVLNDTWWAEAQAVAQAWADDSTFPACKTQPWAMLQLYAGQTTPDEQLAAFLDSKGPAVYAALTAALDVALWQSQQPTTTGATSTSGIAGQPQQGRIKSADYVQALRKLGYSFRINVLDDTIEINGERISDVVAAKLRAEMRDLGFHRVNVMEDAYIAAAYEHRYHPIRDYLSKREWDGKPHISNLASYFVDKHGRFDDWIRRWLIGAVARVFEATQNRMLVLDGFQGLGKSHFVSWLASPMSEHFVEGPIDPANKDSWLRLINKWIWEVAELGSTTRKADREALKHFLSVQYATVRRPYGRYDLHKPALASFIGTVNNESGILSDPTGSRRFMISHLTDIDWGYAKDINPDDVWAEAHEAYLAGETWHLTGDELKAAQSINDLYEVEDPFEGLVKKHFMIDPTDTVHWTPTAELLDYLYTAGLTGSRRSNSMQLANCLNALGLEKKKRKNAQGQQVWGYVGIWS